MLLQLSYHRMTSPTAKAWYAWYAKLYAKLFGEFMRYDQSGE